MVNQENELGSGGEGEGEGGELKRGKRRWWPAVK